MHFEMLNPNIVVSCPNLRVCLRNFAMFDFLDSGYIGAGFWLFFGFVKFWSNVPNFRSLGEGGGIVIEICMKRA